jgi:hypothetical protein
MKRTILAAIMVLAFTGTAQAEKFICTHTHQVSCHNSGFLRCNTVGLLGDDAKPIDANKIGIIHSEIDTKKRTYKRCVSKGGSRTCDDYKAIVTCSFSKDCSKPGYADLTIFTKSGIGSRMLTFNVSDYRMYYAIFQGVSVYLQTGICVKL